MLRRKQWRPIAFLVFLIQLVLEGIAAYQIIQLDMLPVRYLFFVFAVLVIMLLMTGNLLFTGTGHGPSKGRRRRRIAAIILAIALGFVSVFSATMFARINTTVDRMTETGTTLQAMVGVYVRMDDKARSIEDAKAYSFGVMSDYDQNNTAYAVNHLNNLLNTEITTVERPSMTENADALLSRAVSAMIMNESYVSVLKDLDDYADFDERARLIYEIPVEMVEAITAEAASDENNEEDEDVTEKSFIVYVSGSDTRSEILDNSRSDVNILMVVNPKTKQILLLNTPRDYYVANPAGNGALDKLTHCGLYGIECSKDTLAKLYGVEVNYYAQLNFTGFEKLVDAIGGVTVTSPQAFEAGDFSFKQGINDLNGEEALAFSRERYAFADGDNMRGRNQMRVIAAMIDKISMNSTSILVNYADILESLEGMFVTNFSSEELSDLVKMQLADSAQWNVKTYAVTGEGGSETTYSAPNSYAYVMYQDAERVEHATDLINKTLYGGTLSDQDLLD